MCVCYMRPGGSACVSVSCVCVCYVFVSSCIFCMVVYVSGCDCVCVWLWVCVLCVSEDVCWEGCCGHVALIMQISVCKRRWLGPGLNNQMTRAWAPDPVSLPEWLQKPPPRSGANLERLNGSKWCPGPRSFSSTHPPPPTPPLGGAVLGAGDPLAGDGGRPTLCIIQQLLISHYSP